MLRRYGWALFCVKMVNHVGTVSVLIASICINLCGSFCVSRDKFSDLMQSSVSRGMKDFVASYRRYKNLSFLRYQYCWRVIDLTFGGLEFIFEINEVICWPDFDGKWFHRWVWCRRVIFVMFEDWHLLEYSSDVYNIAPELGKLLHTHTTTHLPFTLKNNQQVLLIKNLLKIKQRPTWSIISNDSCWWLVSVVVSIKMKNIRNVEIFTDSWAMEMLHTQSKCQKRYFE